MAIDEKSIKKLWGLAAGICSKPGCLEDCIKFFDGGGTIIGEMAHVIAQSEKGPRGVPGGGPDTYENLILLCPTHHREIDKSPVGTFSADLLHEWKRNHEEWIRSSLLQSNCQSFQDAVAEIVSLLDVNFDTWSEYGPMSKRAQQNPLSNLADYWEMRKLSLIVPNNTRICVLLDKFLGEFTREDRKAIAQFKDHAAAFEAHCYSPIEEYRTFPHSFREMIESK